MKDQMILEKKEVVRPSMLELRMLDSEGWDLYQVVGGEVFKFNRWNFREETDL